MGWNLCFIIFLTWRCWFRVLWLVLWFWWCFCGCFGFYRPRNARFHRNMRI